jgi:hypothetical protein
VYALILKGFVLDFCVCPFQKEKRLSFALSNPGQPVQNKNKFLIVFGVSKREEKLPVDPLVEQTSLG